jgi:hypothetical protein
MRTLSLIVAFMLCGSVAHAEPEVMVPLRLVPAAVEPTKMPALQLSVADHEHSAKVLRNTGIAFTVIGTVLTGVGVAAMMTGMCFDTCNNDNPMAFATGVSLLTFGQLAVLSGVPMWVVGQNRKTRAHTIAMSLTAGGLSGTF